jgi:putative CocE/NonD family hydrolase
MSSQQSEVRDGMRIEWDAPITVDDGVVLRADVFGPVIDGKFPVILSCGPYGKDMAFQESRPFAWQRLLKRNPEVAEGSTTKYQNWEVSDPEKWVPEGYAIVRVDSRGTGRSPGFVDPWSPRETKDLYDCIEWAAVQDWSNGKVGLNGISYFAMNAWQVAALRPPHLAAICAWEGAADLSLPKTRFVRIDGEGRQGSKVQQCLRTARSGVCRARPSRAKREFAPYYNRRRISQEFVEDALR